MLQYMYVLAHIFLNHNYVLVYYIVGFFVVVFFYVKRLEDSFTVIRRYINTLLLLLLKYFTNPGNLS